MHRRPLTILFPALVILATSALSACSTVDDDAAARVNDTELSPDDLSDLVDVLAAGEETNADAVRSTIQTWVLVEVAGAQLEADGTDLTDDELAAANTVLTDGLPGFAELSDATRDTLVNAQATLEVINGLTDGAAFIELATSNADIYIAPRFGQFDPELGVLALAVPPPADDAPVAAG